MTPGKAPSEKKKPVVVKKPTAKTPKTKAKRPQPIKRFKPGMICYCPKSYRKNAQNQPVFFQWTVDMVGDEKVKCIFFCPDFNVISYEFNKSELYNSAKDALWVFNQKGVTA